MSMLLGASYESVVLYLYAQAVPTSRTYFKLAGGWVHEFY
jgi:hypothetical protein